MVFRSSENPLIAIIRCAIAKKMRTSEQIIGRLKELKEDNSISSYTHIKNILKNQLIPFSFHHQ